MPAIRIHLIGLSIIFGFILHTPVHAAAPVKNPYLKMLVQQAQQEQLSEKKSWRRLGHYKTNLFNGFTSEADGRAFFIAPNGKTDPGAELAATLKSFFKNPENLQGKAEHPQCNFPARYKWLKKELAFDPRQLPEQPCVRLQNWLKQLDSKKITLIFASSYMSNPASMFGHTLLRIDSDHLDKRGKLLNYGVNYAANPDTTNAVLYALKGLVGLFHGTFTVFPYYIKVQEYSNWESRDLWEYELNLTPDQVNTLLLHLWELGGTYFDYYYFDENCSYHLLSLLEVANPELELTDQFFYSVLPTQTIKILMEQEGLVAKVEYRPSILSRMKSKKEKMVPEEKQWLHRIVDDPELVKNKAFQKRTVPSKALILDSYLDYLQYIGMQREKENPDQPLLISHSILLERSRLKYKQPNQKVIAFSTRPELGHGSDRVRYALGLNDDELFQEIGYRPTLHDLLAKDLGYGKDSQILFFDLKLRYYYESKKYRLDSYRLIDIISLTPYDPIFTKPSWKLNLGFDTLRDIDCDHCNSFKGNGGYGYSYKSSRQSPFLFFAMVDVTGETSGHLEKNYRLGGGATGGVLIDFTEDWRLQISGDYKRFPLGHESETYQLSVRQRFSVAQNLDLRLEYRRIEHRDEGIFSVNVYF